MDPKQLADAFGVGTRAGLITPQPNDEKYFRKYIGLPEMSKDVEGAWSEDGNVRRPITLKSKAEQEIEESLADKTDKDNENED